MEGVALQEILSWCTAHQLLAICLAVASCTVLSFFCKRVAVMWAYRKVPNLRGVWSYTPLIGDLLPVISLDLTWLIEAGVHSKKFPKAFNIWIGAYPHVVITDLELSRRLLMKLTHRFSHSKLTVRKPLDNKIFYASPAFVNGEKWRAQRRAADSVVLHTQAMAAQVPFVAECTQRLAKYLDKFAASGEPVDVQEALWMMAGDAVCQASFGVDMHATDSCYGDTVEDGWWEHAVGSPEFGLGMINSMRSMFRENDIAHASIYTPLATLLPELHAMWLAMANVIPDKAFSHMCKVHANAQAAIRKMMDQWKAQQKLTNGDNTAQAVSASGLLAKVLSAKAEHSVLDEDEIIGMGLGMVLGGYETTGTSTAMALHYMAAHPDTQAQARQEVDQVLQGKDPVMEDLERLPYVTAVFNETLRLAAPGSAAVREVLHEDMDLGDGVVVPKGAWLVLPTLAFMRDPATWPRATEFLPERHIQPGNKNLAPSNPNAFMPFGYGARLCVGYKFATMEARMALARLLQRFEFESIPKLPPPQARTSITFKPDRVLLKVKHRPTSK